MNVALVSGAYPRREVVARGVSHKLGGEVVRPFSCIEDVLSSSMDYQAYVVYNNFEKRMNGIDGVREIRRRAPDTSWIVGVSSIPYMERQYLPAGADVFLLLAGNEIAELGEILLKIQACGVRQGGPLPARKPAVTATAAPPPPPPPPERADPLLVTENLIQTLERARLLLDYTANDPDPAELQRYVRVMVAEIERVITHYYNAAPGSGNGQRPK